MSRKHQRRELGGEGLTHNPFRALARSPASQGETDSNAHEDPPAGPDDGKPVEGRRVVVRKERKGRGGKAVTVVSWPGADAPSADALRSIAGDLGKALGAGARVEEETVVVQGDQVDRVAAHLESHHAARVTRGTGG